MSRVGGSFHGYNVMHVEIAQAVYKFGDHRTDGFSGGVPQGG
jgi:hypothetical protein